YIRAWQSPQGKRNAKPPTGAAVFCSQNFLIGVAEGKAPALPPVPDLVGRRKVTRKSRIAVGRDR
ncbi:MAG: hypothetical protein WAN03_07030, partial [Candidatus Sulfotelmatobacter sp.]